MNKRYFQIAGITICLEADLDLDATTFNPALLPFSVDGVGEDNIVLQRYFEIPDMGKYDLGNEIFRNLPWAIYENKFIGHHYYQGILPEGYENSMWCFADFSYDFSLGKIYFRPYTKELIINKGWRNLTSFPSDGIWITQFLSDRSALYMHSAAAIINGNGLMFIGRSEAGKTTTIQMLQKARDRNGASVVILCDESNIARRWSNGWRVHGTWSHGEESEVSALSAPLKAIFILKQDQTNTIAPLSDQSQIIKHLLSTMFRPVMTKSWWMKELNIIDLLVKEIPVYDMHFDKSGQIIPILEEFIQH